MSVGEAIRGIKRGFEEAGAATRAMQEDERRQAIAKREDERFKMEKDRADREAQKQKRADAIRERFMQIENDRKTGSGIFADIATPQAAEPAAPAPTRSALPVPGAAPAEAAPAPEKPKDPIAQTLDPRPDSLYQDKNAMWDRYYNAVGSVLREQYANEGDYARAAMVDTEIKKLRESNYDVVRKAALASVVSGVDGPAAEPALIKAYATLGDGRSIKPGSVKYDPKTAKYSMVVVDGDKESPQTYSQMGLAALLQQADPLKVLEFNINRADKDREYALDVRRTNATEVSARAALRKADADSKAADATLKGADQKARLDALNSFFPNAEKSLTLEDRATMGPEKAAAFEQTQQRERTLRGDAERLLALNPNSNVVTVVQIVRDANARGGFKVSGSDDGRPFTMIGGQKFYLK